MMADITGAIFIWAECQEHGVWIIAPIGHEMHYWPKEEFGDTAHFSVSASVVICPLCGEGCSLVSQAMVQAANGKWLDLQHSLPSH